MYKTDSGVPVNDWVSNPDNWDSTYRDVTLQDGLTGKPIEARIFGETPIDNGTATLWALYIIDLGDVIPAIDRGKRFGYEHTLETPLDWQDPDPSFIPISMLVQVLSISDPR